MEHPYHPPDNIQVLLWHLEPQVECIDELGPDLFSRILGEVGVRLDEDLGKMRSGSQLLTVWILRARRWSTRSCRSVQGLGVSMTWRMLR
jgi:hypothetical protein